MGEDESDELLSDMRIPQLLEQRSQSESEEKKSFQIDAPNSAKAAHNPIYSENTRPQQLEELIFETPGHNEREESSEFAESGCFLSHGDPDNILFSRKSRYSSLDRPNGKITLEE